MDHHVVKTVLLDVLAHLHQQEDQAAKDNVRVAVADNALDALELVQVVRINVKDAAHVLQHVLVRVHHAVDVLDNAQVVARNVLVVLEHVLTDVPMLVKADVV